MYDAEVVVTLDANGGWFSVKRGNHIELPAGATKLNESTVENPASDGRVFKEWLKAGATEKFDFNSETVAEDLLLVARWDRYVVNIYVNGESINLLEGAEVKIDSDTKETDKYGFAGFMLPNGEHEYTVSMTGYETLSGKIIIQDRNVNELRLMLSKPEATPPPPVANKYVLTIAAGANSAIKVTRNDANGDALENNAKVKEGDRLFIAAAPASGYELATLTVNGNTHGNNSVFTVEKANVEVKATFNKKKSADTPNAVESTLLAAARIAQNPFSHTLTLEGLEAADRVEVYSLAGIQVYSQKLRSENRREIAASERLG